MVEMKVLLALAARHYAFEANTDTEWVQAVGMIPKVRRGVLRPVCGPAT